MKIVVEWEQCESHGNCMAIAPDVFEVRDDGALYVLNDEPGEELRAQMQEAVRQCPTQSISIEES